MKNKKYYYTVLYNFIDSGQTRTAGWYTDKLYSTFNRASGRIKRLDKMSKKKLSNEFNITEKQAETLDYTIFKLKTKLI